MQSESIVAKAEKVMKEIKVTVDYLVGTMIEVPRAALTADEVAKEAEFFSFGTNDLTRMTFGYSRDDAGKFLPDYIGKKILPVDPFRVWIGKASASSLRWQWPKGRSVKPNLKIGICGEHGGDPRSVEFCHRVWYELRSLFTVPRTNCPIGCCTCCFKKCSAREKNGTTEKGDRQGGQKCNGRPGRS